MAKERPLDCPLNMLLKEWVAVRIRRSLLEFICSTDIFECQLSVTFNSKHFGNSINKRDKFLPSVVVQLLRCVQPSVTLNCSTPGFPVLHYLLEFAQSHDH